MSKHALKGTKKISCTGTNLLDMQSLCCMPFIFIYEKYLVNFHHYNTIDIGTYSLSNHFINYLKSFFVFLRLSGIKCKFFRCHLRQYQNSFKLQYKFINSKILGEMNHLLNRKFTE